jgi:hypothetical protein
MNITISAEASAKSLSDTVRPSALGRLKSGASAPRRSMVEGVAAIGNSGRSFDSSRTTSIAAKPHPQSNP